MYIFWTAKTRRCHLRLLLNVKLLVCSLISNILDEIDARASSTRRSNSRYFTSSFYLSVLTLKCFSSSSYKAILTSTQKTILRVCEIFTIKLHVRVQIFPMMSYELFLGACFPRRQTRLNFQMLPIRFDRELRKLIPRFFAWIHHTSETWWNTGERSTRAIEMQHGNSFRESDHSSALGLNYDLSINIVVRQFLQIAPK